MQRFQTVLKVGSCCHFREHVLAIQRNLPGSPTQS